MECYENNKGNTNSNDFNNNTRIVPIKECRFRAIIIFPLGIVDKYVCSGLCRHEIRGERDFSKVYSKKFE